MEFIAINLSDFHHNQNGPMTVAAMVFVEAEDIWSAQKYMELNHSEAPWALVCKQVFDANIVTNQVYLDN